MRQHLKGRRITKRILTVLLSGILVLPNAAGAAGEDVNTFAETEMQQTELQTVPGTENSGMEDCFSAGSENAVADYRQPEAVQEAVWEMMPAMSETGAADSPAEQVIAPELQAGSESGIPESENVPAVTENTEEPETITAQQEIFPAVPADASSLSGEAEVTPAVPADASTLTGEAEVIPAVPADAEPFTAEPESFPSVPAEAETAAAEPESVQAAVETDLTAASFADEIILIAASAVKTYDGSALTAPEVAAEGLPEGYSIEAAAEGSLTDAGSCLNTVTEYTIRDSEGNDCTSAFANVHTIDGVLTVEPAVLTVVTESAAKAFDGETLRAPGAVSGFVSVNGETETAEFLVYGLQLLTGSSRNLYEILWNGTAKSGNYIIQDQIGTLTVTEAEASVVAAVNGNSWIYDGTAHSAPVSVTNLPEGLSVARAASHASVLNVSDGAVTAEVDELVIVNEAGEDVTSGLNILYENDTISILPRSVVLESLSASMEYDGTALRAAADTDMGVLLSGDGFVPGEGIEVTLTGVQTEPGSSPNTLTYSFQDGTDAGNYRIEVVTGTLTVTGEAQPQRIEAEIQTPPTALAYAPGHRIPFLYIIRNVSGEDLQGVTLTEEKAELEAGEGYELIDGKAVADLPAWGMLYISAAHVITPEDILAGEYRNKALISVGDEMVELSVPLASLEEARAELQVDNRIIGGPEDGSSYEVGELILYNLSLANRGNVNLFNIKVVDVLTGLREIIDELKVGEIKSLLTAYAVEKADAETGTVENRVSAAADEIILPGNGGYAVPAGADTVSADLKNVQKDSETPGTQTDPAQADPSEQTDVSNQPETVTLEIRYLLGDAAVFEPFRASYEPGSSYYVVSPALAGCTPSVETAAGEILENTVIDVVYTLNTYTLRINYIGTDGTVLASPAALPVVYGDVYSVTVPQFAGYAASASTVTGTMPGRDNEVTVFYTPQRTENPAQQSSAPEQPAAVREQPSAPQAAENTASSDSPEQMQPASGNEAEIYRSFRELGIDITGDELIIEEYKTPLGFASTGSGAGECFE